MADTLGSFMVGTSSHTIDPDGRFIIPQRMRRTLGNSIVITRGIEDCLWMMPEKAFEEMVAQWKERQSPWDQSSRVVGRRFIGQSVILEPDRNSRIVIPQHLREAAGLSENIVAVAIGDRVELWNAKKWASFDGSLTQEEVQAAVDRMFSGTGREENAAEAPAA
ncbi:MAG: transcriptional regulator MraZ [Armatimonadota bacterium]|nr:MAG: transcriptional regulator MraZ [Armatimonadota bacterium]